jgi:hypothetical protein
MQLEHGFISSQGETVALTARDELNFLVCLALIDFKGQWNLAVVLRYLLLGGFIDFNRCLFNGRTLKVEG